jgi:hypothetical protein
MWNVGTTTVEIKVSFKRKFLDNSISMLAWILDLSLDMIK